jgi:hypothetical protein
MEKLSWHQLTDIIREYEDKANFENLSRFCAKYYPTATKVKVASVSEYNDNTYYMTFDRSNTEFFHEDEPLHRVEDETELLLLLAASPVLRAKYSEDKPDDALQWLRDEYDQDFYELELCGPERGDDLEVDLTTPPGEPTVVFRKPKGEPHAVPAHE